MIYFDYNATSPLKPEVIEAMMPYFRDFYGNPSSLHRIGRIARDAVENAREQVATLAGAMASQVFFTSGGTEANNLAVRGLAESFPSGRVLLSPIEHPSVLEPTRALAHKGWSMTTLSVNDQGLIRDPVIEAAITNDIRFAVCMLANNETGVIQDIRGIAGRLRDRNILVHSDGVQALGKIPIDFNSLEISSMSLSAHKIGGPKGIGALLLDRSVSLEPLLRGGGQEQGLRGGTENVAAIVGFGAAAELSRRNLERNSERLLSLRRRLERGLKNCAGVTIFAENCDRLPNTVMFAFPGMDGEMLVMELDRKGIAVSSGSACSSQSTGPSHVLLAMGIPEDLARCAVRISLGPENTESEIDRFVNDVQGLLPGLSVTAAGY